MKNVVRFKSTAMIIALILTFGLTACKQDGPSGPNDPSGPSADTQKTVKAHFEGEVSEVVFGSYDLVVNIWEGDVQLVKDQKLETTSFEYNFDVDATKASSITCQVVGTGKSELPAIDPDGPCRISYKGIAAAALIVGGESTALAPKSNLGLSNYSLTFAGSRLADYVARFPQITVMDVTYEF